MIDDKSLLALLDGELDATGAARVRAAVAADPALAAKLEQHRWLGARLRANFDTVLEQPAPSLAPAPKPSGTLVDLAAVRAARTQASPAWRGQGALAACLAAGLAGGYLLSADVSGPVAERAGRLVASRDLGRTLDNQLASDGASASAVKVQLTFRDGAGAVCRSFTGAAASGVACREGGQWRMKGLFPGSSAASGGYRMASAGDARLIRLVADIIVGDPFDAPRELAARDGGWRSTSRSRPSS